MCLAVQLARRSISLAPACQTLRFPHALRQARFLPPFDLRPGLPRLLLPLPRAQRGRQRHGVFVQKHCWRRHLAFKPPTLPHGVAVSAARTVGHKPHDTHQQPAPALPGALQGQVLRNGSAPHSLTSFFAAFGLCQRPPPHPRRLASKALCGFTSLATASLSLRPQPRTTPTQQRVPSQALCLPRYIRIIATTAVEPPAPSPRPSADQPIHGQPARCPSLGADTGQPRP